MSISHSFLSRVFAVGLLAGWSASSLAAVIVTSGTGTTYASARGSYNLPGVYVGSVSGSDSYDIPLPGSETHTTSVSSLDFLPPGSTNNPSIVGGGGSAKLTVDTLLGGLTASGRATASQSSILGVGGGSGSASSGLDVYFTVSHTAAIFNFKTTGAASTYGRASLIIDYNGSNLISYPPGYEFDLHMTLNPGDYHLALGISSFSDGPGSGPVTFQASVVPEVSNVVMTSVAFFFGGALSLWKRRNISIAKDSNIVC